MTYDIVYADPPWRYDDKCLHRGGAERHYETKDVAGIAGLVDESLFSSDCALFMWATFPKLAESLELFGLWGFTYKTCAFVWVKSNKREGYGQEKFGFAGIDDYIGMGRWTRSNAEICLLGTRGKPKRASCGVRQIVYHPVMEHSRKPSVVRDRIVELCGDLPRIELFARQKAEGWDSWGNEI